MRLRTHTPLLSLLVEILHLILPLSPLALLPLLRHRSLLLLLPLLPLVRPRPNPLPLPPRHRTPLRRIRLRHDDRGDPAQRRRSNRLVARDGGEARSGEVGEGGGGDDGVIVVGREVLRLREEVEGVLRPVRLGLMLLRVLALLLLLLELLLHELVLLLLLLLRHWRVPALHVRVVGELERVHRLGDDRARGLLLLRRRSVEGVEGDGGTLDVPRGEITELLLVLLVQELVLLRMDLVLLLSARVDLAPRRREHPALAVRRAREARLEVIPLVDAFVRSRTSSSHSGCHGGVRRPGRVVRHHRKEGGGGGGRRREGNAAVYADERGEAGAHEAGVEDGARDRVRGTAEEGGGEGTGAKRVGSPSKAFQLAHLARRLDEGERGQLPARVGARVGRDGAGRPRATEGEAGGGTRDGVDGRSARFWEVEGVFGVAGGGTRAGEGLLEGVGFEFEAVRVAGEGSSSRDGIGRGANVSSERCGRESALAWVREDV